jgi:hypothetical protein
VLHKLPWDYGLDHTRWRLADLGQVVSWLRGCSEAGISKLLKRFELSLKQAQNFIRSPDPHYREKRQAILAAYAASLAHPDEVVCLFMDEVTYYRQPSLAPAYHSRGHTQPRAYPVAQYNTQTRLVACLNALTGQVDYMQRSRIGKEELPRFYAQIRCAYPQAQVIYLVQDNWPVHKLTEVLQALAEQRLTPVFLPTYASWLNPIEKLWRWLRQDILHLHRLAHDLDFLRLQVTNFLDQFRSGSLTLLHYVGLLSE